MKPDPMALLQGNPLLWRGGHPPDAGGSSTWPTGHAGLDAVLPGGGWPLGALTELIIPDWGIGELRLLLPTMASFTRARRWLIWINPPLQPYAPALLQGGVDLEFCLLIDSLKHPADLPWAMEKLLSHRQTGLVLAWPNAIRPAGLRRLQLAAQAGNSMGALFLQHPPGSSVAALRLGLNPRAGKLEVNLLKARGSWRRDRLTLAFP